MIEYKTGITNALKKCNSEEEIRDIKSPFLNASFFRSLFEIGLDTSSEKFKNNNELMSSCTNILMLVYMKLTNLSKNLESYNTLKFQDSLNLFNPSNFKFLMEFGEKAKALAVMIKEEIDACKKQVEQAKKEGSESESETVKNHEVRMNELYLILDSIDRISDLYGQIKAKKNA